ncbi:hypothetical protein PILCRDRAFT_817222 [Piloderma croceum F 1598]|uniref:Uncharacterized protein n=1 Tax=Piloderma croceum (strain F 1598) TaxID=765440 RepID=A0A0C3BG17_PILCF|nr:hypothetical protein PILCRDRAFT_817222 [Piloderma croceum F 1598]
MGSLCSKSDSHSGGHRVLGSADGPSVSTSGPRPAPRSAAAEAAEARLKSAQARGTNASNPKRGVLAAKVEAAKSAKRVPEQRQEERPVWD